MIIGLPVITIIMNKERKFSGKKAVDREVLIKTVGKWIFYMKI